MRIWSKAVVVAVAATFGLGGAAAAKSPPAKKAATCGEYGTSILFEDSPADAARQAKMDEKLVLVLHISGHFEDPRFT